VGILLRNEQISTAARQMTPDATQEALVIATYSRQMLLRLQDRSEVRARIKGKKIRPVCGDNVEVQPLPNEPEWLITNILPRSTELKRPDSRGRVEILAANLDFLVVVAAEAPPVDWFIVDRYLAAAELMHVPAMVVFNKTDLLAPTDASTSTLGEYEIIGYKTITCSATDGSNMDHLATLLRGHTAIIVGQSGVGKSSLINRMLGDERLRVSDISDATGEGRHTTVNSALLMLPGGGAVIDSPGVRDYAPVIECTDDVVHGFREIREYGQNCRFANCRHLREPDCAVKEAVDKGEISARRYESFRRLLSTSGDLADKRN
jgi:ribosome biogenesis GTPase